MCDEVWLVSASEPEQRKRLMARDGLDEETAGARIASQVAAQKLSVARARAATTIPTSWLSTLAPSITALASPG